MMLRDSGSNMVAACRMWKISHFPCIGHSLHLVVGPFLVEKKKQGTKAEIKEDDEENKEELDTYTDDFTDAYNNDKALARVQKIV